jgi:hypothetical protein
MDCRGERVVAADQAVELVVEHVADSRLQGESLVLDPAGVRPLDPLGHLEEGRPALREDLKPGSRQEPARLAPARPLVAGEGDMRRRTLGERRGEALEV